MTKSHGKLFIGLLILTALTPLGIVLPEIFKAGGAWGEWGPEELEKLVGYAPEGLAKLFDLWKAPAPGYNFGGEGASITVKMLSYMASGLIGILSVGLVTYLISRLIVRHEK